MLILIATTFRGETFVIGHTTSRKRAEKFMESFDLTAEYVSIETQRSTNI